MKRTKVQTDRTPSIEEQLQEYRMRVLVNIEKRQWKAARRNSSETGQLLLVWAKRQVKHIKVLPIFSTTVEYDEKAKS